MTAITVQSVIRRIKRRCGMNLGQTGQDDTILEEIQDVVIDLETEGVMGELPYFLVRDQLYSYAHVDGSYPPGTIWQDPASSAWPSTLMRFAELRPVSVQNAAGGYTPLLAYSRAEYDSQLQFGVSTAEYPTRYRLTPKSGRMTVLVWPVPIGYTRIYRLRYHTANDYVASPLVVGTDDNDMVNNVPRLVEAKAGLAFAFRRGNDRAIAYYTQLEQKAESDYIRANTAAYEAQEEDAALDDQYA